MDLKEIKNKKGDIFPIISRGESLSIMSKLKESVEAKTFIEMALEDEDVLGLLCTHYSTLSMFEKINFPMLFSINRNPKIKSDFPFALVATREGTIAQHTLENIAEKAKPAIENLSKKFLEKYEEILRNINVKSETIVVQKENEQQILGMFMIQVIEEFESEEKFFKLIKPFEDYVIDDVVPVGLALVDTLKEGIFDFGIKNRKKIISASNLAENSYEDTIYNLETKYKVIKPLLSLFWCENEKHEHYSFFMFSHSKVPTVKCPICDKKLTFGTFYYFIPQINYLLRRGEGIIQALTMYIINKTGREWLPCVYLEGAKSDTEKDIVIKKDEGEYCIVEIKSFATDVTPRIKKRHIEQLMLQACNHLESYLIKISMLVIFIWFQTIG